MKYLFVFMLLAGCANTPEQQRQWREIGEALSTAGRAQGEAASDNLRTMQQQPYQYTTPESIDHVCRSRCFNSGLSWAYCTKECSY